MDFCGTHEWTITYNGIRTLMPDNVELIAGPGCPVCITPAYYVDYLIDLSLSNVTILTYGDSYRLPASIGKRPRTLAEAKEVGGDVIIVYSFLDAVRKAKSMDGDAVFFGVGFETTMPSIASLLYADKVPPNMKILSAYRYTPPVVKYLLNNVKGVKVDGIIAPGHVSAVIGAQEWDFIPKEYRIPTVVAGFEALDVLLAILHIMKMLIDEKPELRNEYSRVVKWEGNIIAKKVINHVFEPYSGYWRGIGFIEQGAARLTDKYRKFDAVDQYGLKDPPIDLSKETIPGCKCSEVVLGKLRPTECPLFMKACKPNTPYGPCMVSIEGTCRIWAENPGIFKLKSLTKLLRQH
jgi:hydrogenase expression/formation protein HypD